MPGFDGRGPRGGGPMTGGGRGYCAVPAERPYGDVTVGRFFRRGAGRGAGRGWRNWFRATGIPGWQRAVYEYSAYGKGASDPTIEGEKDMLRNEADALKRELEDIQRRLQELDKETKE